MKFYQNIVIFCAIWYHLHNFKKREKHPRKSITFGKVTDVSLQLYTKRITPA